jgi:hypothetical protein
MRLWDDDFIGKSWGNHGEIMGESMGNAFGTTISWGNHGECLWDDDFMRNAWGMHGGIHGECLWDDDVFQQNGYNTQQN